MSKLEDIYLRLPAPIQQLILTTEGYRLEKSRYNKKFHQIYQEWLGRSFYSKEEMARYQQNQLKAFLTTAATVDFWKKRFEQYGVNSNATDSFAELAKLPMLTKAEVKEGIADYENAKKDFGNIQNLHTSGTTGSGMHFWRTKEAEKIQWAVWWRYRSWHGIERGMWQGYFGGRSIIPVSRKKPPYYRSNQAGRQLVFSAYHLNADTAQDYINALQAKRVPWLHGYPSVLTLLAGYMLEKGIAPVSSIQVITTGAESLLPQQKQIIEKAFAAPVRDHYGQAEGAVNISMCEKGKYHVDEDFAYVEFLPIDGVENEYKVVGTNWTNPAFPLLRYDTGDTVTITGQSCDCGRSGRVIDAIDGRKEDYLTLPDGTKIGRLDHIFKDLINIREAQIEQKEVKAICIKVVKGSNFTAADEQQLLLETRKRIGEEIGIKIEYLDKIPRTKSGKLRFVISTIDA